MEEAETEVASQRAMRGDVSRCRAQNEKETGGGYYLAQQETEVWFILCMLFFGLFNFQVSTKEQF